MNKQELIKNVKELTILSKQILNVKLVDQCDVIKLIERLDEPQKPVVPQLIAEFITEQKKLGHTLSYSIDAFMSDRVAEWYWDNSELFTRAWLDGYEVEKEKRYYVKAKKIVDGCNYLNCRTSKNEWSFSGISEPIDYRTRHTRKELEKAGFGWVFDCPGIEIEEVEE